MLPTPLPKRFLGEKIPGLRELLSGFWLQNADSRYLVDKILGMNDLPGGLHESSDLCFCFYGNDLSLGLRQRYVFARVRVRGGWGLTGSA